jgi:hypothetical protein
MKKESRSKRVSKQGINECTDDFLEYYAQFVGRTVRDVRPTLEDLIERLVELQSSSGMESLKEERKQISGELEIMESVGKRLNHELTRLTNLVNRPDSWIAHYYEIGTKSHGRVVSETITGTQYLKRIIERGEEFLKEIVSSGLIVAMTTRATEVKFERFKNLRGLVAFRKIIYELLGGGKAKQKGNRQELSRKLALVLIERGLVEDTVAAIRRENENELGEVIETRGSKISLRMQAANRLADELRKIHKRYPRGRAKRVRTISEYMAEEVAESFQD